MPALRDSGSLSPAMVVVVSVPLAVFWQNCCLFPAREKGVSSARESAAFRFADCELDAREHRLVVRGQPVTLTPKVFETLVLLVERAGHVVSKDELMSALWPRGFVHESNLTKHIWLIRRALGDGEDEGRCIETVPKLGYRFVAPVQRIVRAETATEAVAPESGAAQATTGSSIAVDDIQPTELATASDHAWIAGRDAERRRGDRATVADTLAMPAPVDIPAVRRHGNPWLIVIGLALVAVLAGVFGWRGMRHAPERAVEVSDPGAVAIVDFNNLSGNAKDAWLGPALEQMLATEVAANGKLHAVSEELVRSARADLPVPEAGGYAPVSLATLQRRLGAHYVLSGAYLVSGKSDAPHLRVDLTVQDAQSGAGFATLSREGAVNDLPGLVAQMGGDLRVRFGERVDPALLKRIALAQPASSEVARHLGFALQALDQFDAARARDELLQAIAQAPGYAPAYLYLSRAWSALGYRAKAVAAAKQAAQNADDLPREQQLQIRAQQAALTGDAAQAAGLRGELVTLHPQDPEYRLQWIAALTAAAKYAQAQSTLDAVRKLPALASDPRLELAAANLEFARDNRAAMVPHARHALALARQRNEAGLIAEAELQLGIALGQDKQAEALLRAAAADYRRIGNPHGEAHAWQNLGNLQSWRNQIALARESYQRAMTIYQGIGDLGGEAAIYDNLSDMLWNAGDRDGTEAALRQALAIARETGDLERQAWTLTGLATVMSDESASDEAAGMYREAITLDRESGARAHLVFALSNYADLLRMRGDLDAARQMCTQAQDAKQAMTAASPSSSADFECAQIALDRGEVAAAGTSFKSMEAKAIATSDTFGSANAQLLLGQIAMGQGRWNDAQRQLQQSSAGWTAMKEAPGEATTAALLALCADALHDAVARDRFAAHAHALRGQVTARAEVFELDVALAQLQAAAGQHELASTALQALGADATRRNWLGLSFEARLGALRVLERGGDPAAIKPVRDALAADARKAGYGWVAQRLAMAQTPPTR